MAEQIVSFLVNKLGDLLIEEAKFLYGVRDQVEEIQTELKRMQCFLRDADRRQYEDERIHNWVSEIRELAYDAEDALEVFAHRVEAKRGGGIGNVLKRYACILNEAVALHMVGSEFENVKRKISSLTTSLQTYGIKELSGDGSSSFLERQRQLRRTYSHVEEDIVGLEKDIKLLVEKLVKEKDCRVVSIIGMGGLGKTTLAKKVYHHSDVRGHFNCFAWACISQKFEVKDILQEMLMKLMGGFNREELSMMREGELLKKLYQFQKERRCLVVIDDIWSTDAWECLRHAFSDAETKSKILITTRNKNVALHVDSRCFLHQPRCLNEDESWKLLQKKAFPRVDLSDFRLTSHIEILGKEMVQECRGLPLAVVLLGGLLATKRNVDEWELVHRDVVPYLRINNNNRQQYGGVADVLAMSYNDLPYQLKPCFLYLANFPEDSMIPVKKLHKMWIAEGLISSVHCLPGRQETMLEVAERCLGELVQRCMVQVQVKESTRKFRFLYLHDFIHDLCLLKAKEENFLKITNLKEGREHAGSCSSTDRTITQTGKIRRLAIYISDAHDSKIPSEQKHFFHLRSLLFFRANECNTDFWLHIKSQFNNLTLLRVLDLEGCRIRKKLPRSIGRLIHLRYLGLKNSRFTGIPSSIGYLVSLETLDLRVCSSMDSEINLPNVIWKLEKMRHLYLPSYYTANKLRLQGLNNLELLRNFDAKACEVKDLLTLVNLRKLVISFIAYHEDLELITKTLNTTFKHIRHSSFCIVAIFYSEDEVALLTQLLGYDHLRELSLRRKLRMLPEHHVFNPNLRKLTLEFTGLKEDPMPTLEMLPNLRFLHLNIESYDGWKISISAQGFPKLNFLVLERLCFSRWTIEGGALPCLRRLWINGCKSLREIPDGLRFVCSLQELKIINMPREFEKLVDKDEGEDFYKVQHVPSVKCSKYVFNPCRITI